MTYTQDLTESSVFTALRSYIGGVLGTAVTEVVLKPSNRVPMPKTYPFITMSPLFKMQIERPTVTTSSTVQSTMMPTEYHIQLDAYGPGAGDIMQILFTEFNSSDAYDAFTTPGIYPLYSDMPHQHPLVDQEAEYEVRWIMDVHLQYNPTLTNTVQTASSVTVGIINVEAAYQ